ncbi:MAG: nucleotidyltransferase domain-containing protein [Acidiferrobacterales bacterium]|nr:nucleotidyltransferase domain-containing protein [Acidiferrobacterales bacterium]
MNLKNNIDPSVSDEVQKHLKKIEKEHNVTVVQAIESGSRAWGFPSPDSDYDVRFVYVHPKDWYLSLFEKRDVIELPINAELDIAGWDLRKALKLANNGNAVVQEWMNSPIVYQQSLHFEKLQSLVTQAFNPLGAYHHYRSMAKKAYFDIENTEQKKLKRFFYFARATLSAKWIAEKQSMPSIVFYDVLEGLIYTAEILSSVSELIEKKAQEPERSLLDVPAHVYGFFVSMYESLKENVHLSIKPELISDEGFVELLKN